METDKNWPIPDLSRRNLQYRLRQIVIVPIVSTLCKIVLDLGNKVKIYNREAFKILIEKRSKKEPLITVSNHHSCCDDATMSVLLRWRSVFRSKIFRWSLAADDICFVRPAHRWFFSSGKCVPITRGSGVYQKGMTFCLERLQQGEWVHIYPEGKVNMTLERMRLKWGVGRLIYESSVTPTVLPYYHVGMDEVLPMMQPYVPKFGKLVTILVGDPMDFTDLVKELKMTNVSSENARKIITDKIQGELGKLRDKAESLHKARFSS